MSRGRNPLLPSDIHFADAEARVMPDGRLYLYCSWDTTRGRYCSEEYRVVSTADLRSFTIHDTALTTADAPWAGATIPGFLLPSPGGATDHDTVPAMLYAPDAIERDGRYFLYFCLSDMSEGVASAEHPWGPFGEAARLPVSGIDPAVFVDDDGQGYYYWGQTHAHGARLNRDMMTLEEGSVVEGLVTVEDHFFHEGSSVRKRDGIYYFVFADESRGMPTCLGYATSTSPLGPFTYRGVIIDNDGCDPATWNNHGSIQEFGGQWYVFYHRSSQGDRAMRRVCVERIAFTDDGLIPEVPMTSQGAGDPYRAGERIPTSEACLLTGTARVDALDGAAVISSIGPGDTATFRYVELSSSELTVDVHGRGRSDIELTLDGAHVATMTLSGRVSIAGLTPGEYELGLRFINPRDCAVFEVAIGAGGD